MGSDGRGGGDEGNGGGGNGGFVGGGGDTAGTGADEAGAGLDGGGKPGAKFSAAVPRMLELSIALPTRETVHVARSTAWKSVAAQVLPKCAAKLATPDASATAD